MALYKAVPIDTPSSRSLAGLNGIRADLEQVLLLCERLIAEHGNLREVDWLVLESLFITAVIRYARCFSGGVRPKLYESLPFSPEMKRFHDFLMDFRDKFVAHSVNPYEQNEVTVTVPEDPPDDWKPEGIGYHHHRVGSLGPDFISALRELATWVDSEVESRMKVQETVVLGEVAAIQPKKLATQEFSMNLPIVSDVKQRRKSG